LRDIIDEGCHYMFVRFRETSRSLQCTLIETRRVDGKVRHEHIASLGSIEVPPSIADRVAFWAELHQRLGRMSNRFSHETHGKLIGQVHARIPMPMPDEQRQLQKENAEADERFWSGIHQMNAATTEKRKGLLVSTQYAIADSEAAAKDAGAQAERARERLNKIEKGEDVQGGLGRPMTREDLDRMSGMSDEQIQHCMNLAELRLSDEEMEKLVYEQVEAGERVGRAIVRKWLRERRGGPPSADADSPPPAT
jgi:hypothetical protein